MKLILQDWERQNTNYDLDEKILSLNLQKGDQIDHLFEGRDHSNVINFIISHKEVKLHEDTIIFHCSRIR